ncbi:MAG: hybrid sensor histidine kinase/response regulator [Desulfobulbaceae bacterium]
MTSFQLINILMVAAGTLIMAAAIRIGLRVRRSVPLEFQGRWYVISLLMFFFFSGYCGYALLQLLQKERILELVSALVFLAGALFVLLVINLSRRTIEQLIAEKNKFAAAHADLIRKSDELQKEIAKQARTEHELREAQASMDNIFNSSIPICITSTGYDIIKANAAYYAMFEGDGRKKATLKCYTSRPGSACNTDRCPVKLISQGKEEVVEECAKIDEAGKPSYFIVTARPYRNAAGEVVGIVESFQDITLRKSAENLLAMEKERLAITLRSIGDGVITTDLKGNILMLNRVAEYLCDWPMDEAVGQPLEEVYHVVDFTTRKRIENPVQRVISTGRAVNITAGAVLIARDGWERFITDSAAPILDQRGNLFGVVLVFRDISEKRLLESEISKLEKLKAIGQLAGGIAHDFNNLLTAILGNISLARISADPASAIVSKLEMAEKAVMRARGLTQQLLTFAKGGAPIKKVISLDQLLRESVEFTLRGSNCLFDFEIAADLRPVLADSGQIAQVMNNLIINANQAMPDGGTVTVRATNFITEGEDSLPLDPGRYVRVTCSDQGSGIPADQLPFVFDPYFTTKKTGSGLGLSTVYSIIRRHGGCITVASQEGLGTTFTFYLPAAEAPTGKEREAPREILKGAGRILVMDDDDTVREVAGMMLTELGYSPTLVVNGQEALAAYAKALDEGSPFACVILDLTIPGGMGGRETMARLVELDGEVKGIVSSGYSSDPVVADYGKYGFKAAVNKPYRLDELSRVLHQALNPPFDAE